MTPDDARRLLEQFRAGDLPLDAALSALTTPAVADLGFARIDLSRRDRCGYPEVVFAQGKRPEWVTAAVERLHAAGQDCLVTRLDAEQSAALAAQFPNGRIDELGRTFWWPVSDPVPVGRVLVVTAGTTDLPVAQEAAVTARALGATADVIADVGVAGLHRVLARLDDLRSADAIVAVAGMDGALPSVVGGLVACPVIACPTSTAYGTAFGGVAALLTMLNACAANVVVVNIDAGFKAGYTAALIARAAHGGRSKSS